ncbi:MAG: 1-phosphofructokinase family hexose kinase [Thermoleophilia bacterium]|nr:1-phosphofructokinase family hexose kinase [Thermoleophilia bacterium]
MIVTVTLNAALDRTLTVPNFQAGFRHRASESLTLPGGKGVNIARALKSLGQPVIATGLAGGKTGIRIVEDLTAEGILNDFVRIRGESRTSTAIIDPTSNTQTELNEYGPVVTARELHAFMEKFTYIAKGADVVIIAGSLPRKVKDSFYKEIIGALAATDALTVLDTAGEPLRMAIKANPGLVSPNIFEAEALVGHEFSEDEDTLHAAVQLSRMGAGSAIITHPGGCFAYLDDGEGSQKTYTVQIPPQDPISTVGSGDAFLAGYVSARVSGKSESECLRYAVACGAANTQKYGAGVFDVHDVKRFITKTKVEEVDLASTA